MREYKVVVLGSGGVGKSALTVQFVSNTFIEKVVPVVYYPVGEEKFESVHCMWHTILRDCLNSFGAFTAYAPAGLIFPQLRGQVLEGYVRTAHWVYKYDPTIEDFYRKEIEVDGAPSVLEILDTAGTEQFASMRDLYIKNGQGFVVVYSITSSQTFHDIKGMRDQIVRVKGSSQVPILLVGNKCDLDHQRQVRPDEGLALAEHWACPFVEASAKISQNVNTVFAEIVREMNYVTRQKLQQNHKLCCAKAGCCSIL